MKRIVIEGGAPLSGEIFISGAKNAVLPLMTCGILLSTGSLKLRNVPAVFDVETMVGLLKHLGLQVEYSDNTIEINASDITRFSPPARSVSAMRASVLVIGPMLAKYGRVEMPMPGGCAIGARPIDQHLKVFAKLGAKVDPIGNRIRISAKKLRGTEITFDISTVTGTENAIMSSALAQGRTILHNCAKEPEVVELATVLNKMGAKIKGAGTSRIVIDGVSELKGIEHNVMPDRIEAGTYVVASALVGDDVKIKNISPELLRALLVKLQHAGVTFEEGTDFIRVYSAKKLKNTNITTGVYPGFPTDLQAQFMALMCFADGLSKIKETIFENRFLHVKELIKMGADINLKGNTAYVRGVKRLHGARVRATDLRASACLVIAGLGAEGVTEIEGLEHLDRGYEKIEDKLSGVGARIKRVEA